VENLFMMKYEGLSEAAKEVLKKASIIGKGFTLNEIIETQSHRKNEDISSVISELKEKEIIDITDLAPEVQYLFNNVLMRQAVYSTILRGEKKDLHNRIARFYENKYAQRLEQNSELLAYHYHLGENKDKARCYSKLAAQRNQAVNNHGEAVYFFQIALQNSGNPNERQN
jgi:predicted ATPase